MFDNILKVYNKNMELIAIFTGDTDGISEDAMSDLVVAPTIHIEQNGVSRLTFQMLADSEKWDSIKDPENLYHINDRWYTPMTDNAYQYTDENGVSVVNVMCVETWALLSRVYTQAFNCGIYCYAKARFNRYVNDGAEFIIYSSGCSNPGNTISNANAWSQVRNWERTDSNGNQLTYAILTQDEYKPTGWKDFPSGVFMKSFSVSGNTATMVIESRSKVNMSKAFQYSTAGTYNLGATPIPSSVSKVVVTTTTVTGNYQSGYDYNTTDKEVWNYSYNSSTGILNLYYRPSSSETVNAVTVTYTQNNLGEISPGATCTFAYGAEVVDEHTFVVLPKAKSKYKLTINGTTYEDSQVRDSRGVIMPRGSAGYAMWAALKNSGWTLGICDVLAKGFDTSIDYGCFNIESDMKDVLYIVQYIQKLYGGILDWDSEHKILNYRAENSEHYQAYNDGFNEWKGYAFREGKNITERPLVTYDNTIITRAYLLGYGNLNVRKVNNNKSYVDDFSYTNAIYSGYLKQELIYDTRDEGGQRQLLYWGQRELAKQCRPRKTITLTVTDTRTVEGLEHEVFDINDIVKVYYHDESTGTDTVELQRVVSWEYNAFAMWDCTVELGDKTANEIELFKLIYNKSMSTPGTNGSGNLPGGNITMGDSNNQNSITNYIQLIARTTTENSDAMAGLIMDTSSTHAQVDLFAYYQKQIDGMLKESYAGLQFYADEQGAQAIIEANHHSDKITKDLDGTLRKTISDTAAGIRTEAKDNYASLQEYARVQVKNLEDGKVKELINSYSELKRTVTDEYALKEEVTGFRKEVFGDNGKPGAISEALNKAMVYADENFVVSTEFNGYKTTVNNEFIASKTEMMQYADSQIARITLTAAAYTDRWGNQNGTRLTLTQHGVWIEDVYYDERAFYSTDIPLSEFVPETIISSANIVFNLDRQINGDRYTEGMADVLSKMEGWRYGDSTFIDGSQIMTGTVTATMLKGGEISLLDKFGLDSGTLYLRGASSHDGYALEIFSPAIGIHASDGDVWIQSGRNTQLHAPNKITFDANIISSRYPITQHSDKSIKKNINYDMSEYIKIFNMLKPCSYQMIDESISRTYTGFIADDVEDILNQIGVDTTDFAGFEKDETGFRSLRYTEFISLCVAKIQEQDKELKRIKNILKI